MEHVTTRSYFAGFALTLALSAPAIAYPVAQAMSLDEMAETADLVVKAKALSTGDVEDAWFKSVAGFVPCATRLQVISVLKGEADGESITFRHYVVAKDPAGRTFMPQHYEFTPGRSYIVFAKKAGVAGVFRQLWLNHRTKKDQGVLLAADDKPRAGKSIRDVYWSELTGLLGSVDADNVVYAVQQLDQMSGSGWADLSTFTRKDIAEAIRPLLASKDEKILTAVIEAGGSRNPYMHANNALFWLATVGRGHLPGVSKWDPKFDNVAGRLLWRELTRIANSGAPAKVRALAVRAVGRTAVVELPPLLERWIDDDEPLVRQAVVVVLTDFPGEAARRHIQAAAGDRSAEVRQGAAQAIGFGQITSLVPVLGKLLGDDIPAVCDAAAMSLLSFAVETSGELLRANIKDPEYRSLFVNALAADDPAPYVADLAEVIAKHLEPRRFWGGRIPAADSWDILFKYVQLRPTKEFQSGKLNAALDALEELRWHSSSEPRDLYALYLQRELTDRANAFRARCREQVTYNIDYYFDMVDKRPDLYKRE